jgi:excisionase family DNA binding protein
VGWNGYPAGYRRREWMTTRHVAKALNVTTATVGRWVRAGQLPATLRATGRWYVSAADFSAFVRRQGRHA